MVEGYDLPSFFMLLQPKTRTTTTQQQQQKQPNNKDNRFGPKRGPQKKAPKKGQVDRILPPSKVGLYDLRGLFFGHKKVDHILPPFSWPKTFLSAEGEGYVDQILPPYFCICFLTFFFALGMVEGYDLPNFGQSAYFCRMEK